MKKRRNVILMAPWFEEAHSFGHVSTVQSTAG